MNKVLVTGGGGFVGQALVRRLVERGCAVTVLGRSNYPALEGLGLHFVRADLRDMEQVQQALAGQDTVFHVAAKAGIWGPQQEYFSINLTGTRNVLAACKQQGVARCIYTSTPSVVFNQQNLIGADETLPYATRPLCHYAASKILAEQEVLQAHNGSDDALQTIALRPHLIWGPGDQHLIPRLLDRGRRGLLKVVGNGQNRVDISYIDNVVQAHILAAEHLMQRAGGSSGGGQAFFIGQEQPVALWTWINTLFKEMGIPPVERRVPFVLAYAVGRCLEWAYLLRNSPNEPRMTRFLACQLAKSHWFSHRKAENLLGYCPEISTEAGMETLLAWLRQEAR